jgi:hypothetical protein
MMQEKRHPVLVDYAFTTPHTLAEQLRALAAKLDRDDKKFEEAWADTMSPADFQASQLGEKQWT